MGCPIRTIDPVRLRSNRGRCRGTGRLGPMRPIAYSDAVSQSQTVPENAVVIGPE